jgi:hypothetical protein
MNWKFNTSSFELSKLNSLSISQDSSSSSQPSTADISNQRTPDLNVEYPNHLHGSKSEVLAKDIDKDIEAMEKRMAENESRSNEISRSINQDNVKVDDDSRLPSLEWYGSSPDQNVPTLQNENNSNKVVSSSSPTKSDIELREM